MEKELLELIEVNCNGSGYMGLDVSPDILIPELIKYIENREKLAFIASRKHPEYYYFEDYKDSLNKS